MKHTRTICIPIALLILTSFVSCKRSGSEVAPASTETAPAATQETPQTAEALRAALAARNPDYKPRGKRSNEIVVRDGKIVGVNLAGNKVHDISPLRGLPLEDVNLARTDVIDLSPLKGMPLQVVNIPGTKVVDFSFLAGMHLRELNVRGTPFQDGDLALLKDMPLEVLNLGGTQVKDISPLKNMPLRVITLWGQSIEGFSPLAGLPLRELHVDNTRFRDSDLALLKGMPLEVFSLNHTKVKNLSPIEGMPLKELSIRGTAVSDISPLRNAPLVRLDLARTKITDISILKDKHLESLNTEGTKVFGATVSGKGNGMSADNPMGDGTSADSDTAEGDRPTARPSPAVFPTSSDQPPLETLSQEAPNATAWVLAPLDQAVPDGIRQNLTTLREDLLDESKAKPAAGPEAYAIGRQLCDALIAVLDERDANLVRFGYRKAQANANTRVTSQALEARRNYMMSWPQYAREQNQAAEIFRQQKNSAAVTKELPKVEWSNRTALLRKTLDALYAKYREALRQGIK